MHDTTLKTEVKEDKKSAKEAESFPTIFINMFWLRNISRFTRLVTRPTPDFIP